ncbi:MAG: hypothetical protein EZS28_031741, partial [Streblomastix strix]
EFEEGNTIAASPNYVDLKGNKQDNQGSDRRSDSCSELASLIMVGGSIEDNSQTTDSGQMRRCLSSRRTNAKAKTTPPAWRLVDCKVQGNRGDEIYTLVAKQRGLNEQAVQSSIKGWHSIWRRHRQRLGQFWKYWEDLNRSWEELRTIKDLEAEIINYVLDLQQKKATDNNIVESVAALSLLFKVAGQPLIKIQGKMLQQIMKKHRFALKKIQKEESIYSLNDLLEVLEDQAQRIKELPQNMIMGCTIVSITIFSVLRMAEVIRSSAIEGPDGSWQIQTETWKGGDEGVVIAFRRSQSKFTSPVFWLSQWISTDQKRMEPGCLWYLIRTGKVATESQISKSVHEVMKLAGIEVSYTVTSIRSSSITKQISIGATKQQVNRFSRHKKGLATVSKFYDKNLNDNLRERLAVFKR